jgi:hypothetical protein
MKFKNYTCDSFAMILEDSFGTVHDQELDTSPSISISVGYLEVHKFKVCIHETCVSPEISPFAEVRIVECDPLQLEMTDMPGPETIWSGRTILQGRESLESFTSLYHPRSNEQFECILGANPVHSLIVSVFDGDGIIRDNTPMGMAVVPMKTVISKEEGVEQSFEMNLDAIPKRAPLGGIERARVHFSVSHELSMNAAEQDHANISQTFTRKENDNAQSSTPSRYTSRADRVRQR